jgi:hypothetical protein
MSRVTDNGLRVNLGIPVVSRVRHRVAAIVSNRTNHPRSGDITPILHLGLAAEAGPHHYRYHKAKGRRESRGGGFADQGAH